MPGCQGPGPTTGFSAEQLQQIITEVLRPCHFFAREPLVLTWEQTDEDVSWEVFRGRLLDPAHTRERRHFLAWHIWSEDDSLRAREPILSVKLAPDEGRLHVVRALPCHAWEGYDAGNNVYLSRECVKWTRELVGSLDLGRVAGGSEVRDEIAGLLFRAVVGTSRLPLTSVEAPLPSFSLGDLGYFFHENAHDNTRSGRQVPMHCYRELIEGGLQGDESWLEKAKLLELLLRGVSAVELEGAARQFVSRWKAIGQRLEELPALLRTVFNEVALSPFTQFVDRTLAFVQCLVSNGYLASADQVDFLTYLLRQLSRHLTAYDLVTFHHAGANYPDALLLDAVLKACLDLAEHEPALFLERPGDATAEERRKRRRRGLRQGWLLRRRYEGHPVPDAPTSPGENARVLPPPHVRVPEEQITHPTRRTRRLYADDLLTLSLKDQTRSILAQSCRDLLLPSELRELGMAVFIERPLGVFKAIGEADQTLLLAHEAFSKRIAEERLRLLVRDVELAADPILMESVGWQLRDLTVAGLPLTAIADTTRPVVALADARRVADDFVVLRTLPGGVRAFLEPFDLNPLGARIPIDFLTSGQPVLIVRARSTMAGPESVLAVFDGRFCRRLELEINQEQGYARRAGMEYPAGGLRVVRAWDEMGNEQALAEGPITLGITPPPAAAAP
jgi:hypothetical protein